MDRLTDEQSALASDNFKLVFWAMRRAGCTDDESYDAAIEALFCSVKRFDGRTRFGSYGAFNILRRIHSARIRSKQRYKRLKRIVLARKAIRQQDRDNGYEMKEEVRRTAMEVYNNICAEPIGDTKRRRKIDRLMGLLFNTDECEHECAPFEVTYHSIERWEDRIDRTGDMIAAYKRAEVVERCERGEHRLWDRQSDAVFFVLPIWGGWRIATIVPKPVYDRGKTATVGHYYRWE